jgi:uncharacterized protein (DUF1015 family)
MAEVRAFHALRFDSDISPSGGEVTCPPYDVMDRTAQTAFHERHPNNVVRLELGFDRDGDGEAENRYTRAAATLDAWRSQGILKPDESASLYRYAQTFRDHEGATRTRTGVFTLLKVEPFEAGVVLPHEETFPQHKEDRFRLISACQVQISPIFGLFRSPDPSLHAQLRDAPLPRVADFVDEEGVRHELSPIVDPGLQSAYSANLSGCQVFIADGHHRYETALRYRDERRAESPGHDPAWFDYVMILLAEMSDPGLVVFPTHRLIGGTWPLNREELGSRLGSIFLEGGIDLASDGAAAEGQIRKHLERHSLVLVLPSGQKALVLRLTPPGAEAMERASPGRSEAWRDLDVAILHQLVIPQMGAAAGQSLEITYTHDIGEALHAARNTDVFACLVAPATVEDLRRVSLAGERMPHKSTFFYPKARTGLVLHHPGSF